MNWNTARTYALLTRSNSPADISFGLQTTPPFAPPKGKSSKAHFHVIQAASARTVSIVSSGWNRMPPLVMPLASLYWTRNPWNTLTEPSSMRTGNDTWSSRMGVLRIAVTSGSKSRISAHLSSCFCTTSNGLIFANSFYSSFNSFQMVLLSQMVFCS